MKQNKIRLYLNLPWVFGRDCCFQIWIKQFISWTSSKPLDLRFSLLFPSWEWSQTLFPLCAADASIGNSWRPSMWWVTSYRPPLLPWHPLVLLPFMCYDHPNGQQSVLKYSSTLCGSADHISMTIIGASLFVLSLSFFALCCFAARQAPSWSMGSPSVAARLTGIVFLIQRFRPSKWWFGLILLARGEHKGWNEVWTYWTWNHGTLIVWYGW